MNNSQFLAILKKSFITYLQTGARSNKKLGILHGAISEDLQERLNDNTYSVYSLGYGIGKEHKINGRYVDKAVDITITENNQPIAGIAVKYVMSNYSQISVALKFLIFRFLLFPIKFPILTKTVVFQNGKLSANII